MKTITKIDVLSSAKIVSFIQSIIGLILGFLGYLLEILYSKTEYATQLNEAMGFSQWDPSVIVIYPILYAIIGFIAGALVAYLYNIFASKWGGLKINIK